jgi:hypothetical protein
MIIFNLSIVLDFCYITGCVPEIAGLKVAHLKAETKRCGKTQD